MQSPSAGCSHLGDHAPIPIRQGRARLQGATAAGGYTRIPGCREVVDRKMSRRAGIALADGQPQAAESRCSQLRCASTVRLRSHSVSTGRQTRFGRASDYSGGSSCPDGRTRPGNEQGQGRHSMARTRRQTNERPAIRLPGVQAYVLVGVISLLACLAVVFFVLLGHAGLPYGILALPSLAICLVWAWKLPGAWR